VFYPVQDLLRYAIDHEDYNDATDASDKKTALGGYILCYLGLVLSYFSIHSRWLLRRDSPTILFAITCIIALVGCILLWASDLVPLSRHATESERYFVFDGTTIPQLCGLNV
jgi:hypothetical protein